MPEKSRAPLFHHADDPTCRHIDDQYYFGNDLLVAPVMNDSGIRRVYLPAGEWVDFWTGEWIDGPRWLTNVRYAPGITGVYVRSGAELPVYPEPVLSTAEMDPDRVAHMRFERGSAGFPATDVARALGLTAEAFGL